jgi:hypothetical protein
MPKTTFPGFHTAHKGTNKNLHSPDSALGGGSPTRGMIFSPGGWFVCFGEPLPLLIEGRKSVSLCSMRRCKTFQRFSRKLSQVGVAGAGTDF